ncbi:MAG: HAMP domain-containing protein [Ruminococcus sp.]|nr:HAMP domain-containing protein [Ruminococcus sp.]
MNSIKRQLIAVFLGLLATIFVMIFVMNSSFLGRYYLAHKKADMIGMYQMLGTAVEDEALWQEKEVQRELQTESERANISVTVANQEKGVVLQTEQVREGTLPAPIFGYLTGKNQGELLEKEENYVIYKAEDFQHRKNRYLEMFGELSDGSLFLLQSPLESIRDSAGLANKFLIYVGIVTMLFGALLVWFFSRKITEPILELAALSKRMADLDFDVKYTGGGRDEIGILGENFNSMSRKLERTISELKRANNQLQKDIQQKEKMENMRTEFLGNVSHELKTPIALIQGYAEGLKEGISEDPESREFYCDVIMDEANKMTQMVRNLLTLNQLEFGAEELEVERFDVVRLIQGVLASCEILIQQAGATVDFIADEKVFVWADEFKTEQVFRNYLTNALHHVDYEKRIEIRVIPKGNLVRVTVFNSGAQIPEEDLSRLWDKFYKVDKAHTREYGGNGIGLSIVRAIMESFHQQYGVCNFDNGVEFWFELDAENYREETKNLEK